MNQTIDELQAERDFLRDLRATHRGNIQKLQLQEATFAGQTPVYILSQLEREQQALRDVEARLLTLEQQLQHTERSGRDDTAPVDLLVLYTRYQEHLITLHQTLSFQGVLQTAKPIALPLLSVYVDTRLTVGSGSHDTMSLQERRILSQLEEPCDDETRVRLEQELERLGRTRWSSQSARVHLAEVLTKTPVSIILGDPGAGKSTLLRFLALVFAKQGAPEYLSIKDSRLPILIPLAAYDRALQSKAIPLSDFLASYYAEYQEIRGLDPLFQAALNRGQALVLLDGLDEVLDSATRVEIAQRVQSFITQYAPRGNRILVTSRIVGYRMAPLPGSYPHYTVADFGIHEIERFTEQWCRAYEQYIYGATPEAEQAARREHRQLMGAIKGTVGIERLAANPLLLTILALIHRQGQSLPQRRVQLYDVYLNTLLQHWSRARQQGLVVGKALDAFEAIPILGPLALWLQTNRPAGTAQYPELLREVTRILTTRGIAEPEREAHSWLADLREHSGLLLERGADAWGFLHLTFQEYLAAWGLARMTTEDRWATIKSHLHAPRWHEVIHLTAGILGVIQHDEAGVTQFVDAILHAGSRVETLLHRDLFLAASVIADDVGVAPALGHAIIQQLADVWWEEIHHLQSSSTRGWWGGVGSHRNQVATLATRLRGTSYLPPLLDRLRPAFTDTNEHIVDDALYVVGMVHDWDTLSPYLKTVHFSDSEWIARLLLEDEQWDLLQIYIDHASFSEPTPLCRELARVDRWDLIKLMVEGSDFPDDSFRDFVSFLITSDRWDWISTILEEGYGTERADVVLALGDNGLLDKIRFALTDPDAEVREAAIWSFAEAGDMISVEAMIDDPSPWVRHTVFGVFAEQNNWGRVQQGLQDPESFVRSSVLRWLHETPYAEDLTLYLTNNDPDMRRTALDLLDAAMYPDLVQSLLKDPNIGIRRQAIQKLANAGMWDDLQPLLHDLRSPLRSTAVQHISNEAPFTYILPVLKDDDPGLRRLAIRSAVRHQRWDVLWPALDDPEPGISSIALSGLVTKLDLTANEQELIESYLKKWDMTAIGSPSVLHDVITQYEQTLEQMRTRVQP